MWVAAFCCKEEHDDEGCDLLPGKRDSSHPSPPESGKNKSKKIKSRSNKPVTFVFPQLHVVC